MTLPADPAQLIVLFFGAMIAGAINALAGGGTVISYPAMLFAGLSPIMANATNTAALVPGSLGSVVAYRGNLGRDRRTLLLLLAPTVAGALTGAAVVSSSSEEAFRRLVPFLVLAATLLFAFREPIAARLRRGPTGPEGALGWRGLLQGGLVQFFIALYGGYFGAGIGILMLTSLSLLGFRDIHRMNALKAALAAAINGTALVFFALAGKVVWPLAVLGMLGATLGGYGLARLARRIPPRAIRAFVVVFGLIASVYLFARAQGWL